MKEEIKEWIQNIDDLTFAELAKHIEEQQQIKQLTILKKKEEDREPLIKKMFEDKYKTEEELLKEAEVFDQELLEMQNKQNQERVQRIKRLLKSDKRK